MGLPGNSAGKESTCNAETPVQFLGWQDPLEKGRLCTSAFLGFPGDTTGKESVCNAGYLGSIPGWEDALDKETATYSGILAWRIRWTV